MSSGPKYAYETVASSQLLLLFVIASFGSCQSTYTVQDIAAA